MEILCKFCASDNDPAFPTGAFTIGANQPPFCPRSARRFDRPMDLGLPRSVQHGFAGFQEQRLIVFISEGVQSRYPDSALILGGPERQKKRITYNLFQNRTQWT